MIIKNNIMFHIVDVLRKNIDFNVWVNVNIIFDKTEDRFNIINTIDRVKKYRFK